MKVIMTIRPFATGGSRVTDFINSFVFVPVIVSKVKISLIALSGCSLIVFVFVFSGQIIIPCHSGHMSQRSLVSGIAFWRFSIYVIVIVIVSLSLSFG